MFLRWRGEPPFGETQWEQLVGVADRVIVDSSEWDELRYAELAEAFERTAVSDIAWARTDDWRIALAGRWPGDRDAGDRDPRARGRRRRCSAAGSPRVSSATSRPVEPAGELGVRLDGEEVLPPHRGGRARRATC